MGIVMKALSETQWWGLVRGMEGDPGEGPISEIGQGPKDWTWTDLVRYRDTAAVWIMGGCGLRVGELVKLVQSDVFYGQGSMHALLVRGAVAKTGEERTVPLGATIRSVMDRLMNGLIRWGFAGEDRPVFGARGRWQKSTLRTVQTRLMLHGRTHLNMHLHPHMLRHTFASRLRRRVDLPVVQALLGHRNLSSTQVYMNVMPEDLSDAIEKLEG